MPWRGIFVVAMGLLTSGCIFSAYQIASWSVTGVSYVFTGKGLGDHALSLATSKDCATWRILQSKQVCVDYGSDFEGVWDALASSWRVPDVLRQPVAVADADRVETSLVPSAVRVDAASRTEEATRTGLDFKGLVAPPGGLELEDAQAPWLASAGFKPALDFGGLIPRGDAVERVSEKRTAASAPAMQIASSVTAIARSRPAIYLVLGSFSDRENADALRERHAGRDLLVLKSRADNGAIFRVLAGPIAAAVLTKARVDIAKAGIRNAWAVRLCGGSLAPPPCEPVLQQASLPGR